MAKLLGIDVGTSGCKAVLVNEHGEVLRQGSAEYPIRIPRPLWSEQDPGDWWTGVQKCIQAIGESAPDAIGLTGQMHGSVFLDAEDQVVRPAILWNDQRTAAECEEIDRTVGAQKVRQITCNPPLTGFQLPKLIWLRNNEPDNFKKVRSLLLPKDYIRLMLTGAKATDVSDASGTGILDVPGRGWSREMFDDLRIAPELMPECFESSRITGHTRGVRGLNDGIPVVAGGGDQAAGAVGTGAVKQGVVSVSLGTSGVVFTSIDGPRFDPAGAAHTFCHANGEWHVMGVMLSCGGALRWYRDVLGRAPYDELARDAMTAPAGCDGLAFLPYLTGERCPHNDPSARGAFAGITLGHERRHFSRAVFEGISLGLLDAMDLLRSLGASTDEVRVTGGGAKSEFWVQMLADMFGTRFSTLDVDEGPAFGAAILAGVGSGVWVDVKTACAHVVRVKSTIAPSGVGYEEAHSRYRALYRSLKEWNTGSEANPA